MRQFLLLFIFTIGIAGSSYAQDVYSSSGKPLNRKQTNVKDDRLIDPDRIIFGGWGNFGIGNGILNLGITPVVGYRITDGFSAGIGFGYQYFRVKNYNTVIIDGNTGAEEFRPLNAHIYSPSVWGRHIIWNNIFAQVEYEHNIFSQTYYTNDFTIFPDLPVIKETETITVPSLLVGGGLRQPLGRRASVVFMVLYDVLQDENSPYYQTVAIRFGVNFGF